MSYVSEKRLYLTSDDQVVEEGDERAATLLVGVGGQLSDAHAAHYGLSTPDPNEPPTVGALQNADHLTEADARALMPDAPKSGKRAGQSDAAADVPAAEPANGSDSAKATPANTKAIDAPEGNK